MERASARFASRCGGKLSIRPHLCATFSNATQRCGQIDRAPPRWLGNRELAHPMRTRVRMERSRAI
eukprot:32554-Lingulodinium_polyedra.AAC.1